MTHRFFIPSACITPPTVQLTQDTAHQIINVLRMQPGDTIMVLDNSGTEWQVELTAVGKRDATGKITAHHSTVGEPKLHLTLYQGTLKAQKFEWVLQKGTELGVSYFVPVVCQRSVVRDGFEKKVGRWQQIIQEAAEQSGRGKLPHLAQPMNLPNAIAQCSGPSIMPWENSTEVGLKAALSTNPSTINLFIGPEGGFTAEEAILAEQAGTHLITLGPRILRAETAALAVCAAIMYELDQWVLR